MRRWLFRVAASISLLLCVGFTGLWGWSYWKAGSVAVRRDAVEARNARMTELRDQLADAVSGLDSLYPQLKASARLRLGRLYCEADYPASLAGLFGVDWDSPSVEPPAYLRPVDPLIMGGRTAACRGPLR